MLPKVIRISTLSAVAFCAIGALDAANPVEQTNYYLPQPAEAAVMPTCPEGGRCVPNACRTGACTQENCPTCSTGNCPTVYAHPSPGMDVMAGRPYTLGDMHRDLHAWKHGCDDDLGLSGHSLAGGSLHSWWCNEVAKAHSRRAYRNWAWNAHCHNKFNYFTPSGCCGGGCSPFGCYRRVYATSPGYFDARDKQVFASPMTGVPMAVPLAPNVHYQYNYGWGIPSSRVTPVSTIVPPRF